MQIEFTEPEFQCVLNALDRAAERYEVNAATLRGKTPGELQQLSLAQVKGYAKLARQFDAQRAECLALRLRLGELA